MEPEPQNTNFNSVTLQPDEEELPTQLTLGYSPKMAKAYLVGLSTATCRLQQPWSSSHLTNKRVCNCRRLTDQPFLPINGQVIPVPYRTWYETIFALLGVSMIATITMYTTVANTGGSYENLKTKSSSEVDENKNLFTTGKLECRTNIYEECTVGPGYRNIVL